MTYMAWVLKEVLFEQCPKIRLILSHVVAAGFMMSYGVTLSEFVSTRFHQGWQVGTAPFVRSASMFWPQADQELIRLWAH